MGSYRALYGLSEGGLVCELREVRRTEIWQPFE